MFCCWCQDAKTPRRQDVVSTTSLDRTSPPSTILRIIAQMTAWTNTLPTEMASAIAKYNLSNQLAPFCYIFTIRFGKAPDLSSNSVSLDDMNHLNEVSLRSVFFNNLLNTLGMTVPRSAFVHPFSLECR